MGGRNKPLIVVIVGPTAVGKSEIGITLAQQFDGEIISGDSMQIYRGLDIGTAKVSPKERRIVPHHLIDLLNPSESYSAAAFKEDAKRLILELTSRGKLPFIVGGTGFYIRGLTRDLDFHETPQNPTYRKQLEAEAKKYGPRYLHDQLKKYDPKTAAKIHPNNVKKMIRTLEIFKETNHHRDFEAQQEKESPYEVVMIGLTMVREKLYQRINERVDQMVAKGLIAEAKMLYDNYPATAQAAQAIGYKEFFPYFRGEISKEKAIDTVKRNSRRYAKRQLTWFRNKENVEWFDISQEKQKKIQEMISRIEGKIASSSN